MKHNFKDLFLRKRPGEERRSEVVDRLSGKVSKEDAGYRPTSKGDKGSCGECEHYLLPGNPTSNCRRVAGSVYADDTCDYFTARTLENNSVAQPSNNGSM